jgi:hypothetical protein
VEESTEPAVEMSRTDEALVHLMRLGLEGLTSKELDKKRRLGVAKGHWSDKPGLASTTLSRLKKHGCAVQTEVKRDNRFAYVVTDVCKSHHEHKGR